MQRLFKLVIGGNCNINGGTYKGSTKGTTSKTGCIALVNGNLNITNAIIYANAEGGTTRGLVLDEGSAKVTNCKIVSLLKSTSDSNEYCYGVGINTTADVTISDCDIKAYSNYNSDGVNYGSYSVGIKNEGILTIEKSYVMGTHSGISNYGELRVYSGTYEGYAHGGIYFAGTGITSYVRNAKIRECDMPEGYIATSQDNNAGFYIGGAAGNDNIKVYMDNCDIYGSVQPIVLRGSSGEKNNKLYISNSKINIDKKIRIDASGHELYIGVGNNFTVDNINLNASSSVIVTTDTYIQN